MVSMERNLINALLKLTIESAVEISAIRSDAKLSSSVALDGLRKLQTEGLIAITGEKVEADTTSRMKLAMKAITYGADIELISKFLCWQEFEKMAALALDCNGYVTSKNLRFKHVSKRWEIDVVGCRKPLVVCVDCKHYQHSITPAVLRKMTEEQIKRVKALSEVLPNADIQIECVQWSKTKFLPVILSLMPGSLKFINNVPIVPVLQLQSFLNQLPLQLDAVKYFSRTFSHL